MHAAGRGEVGPDETLEAFAARMAAPAWAIASINSVSAADPPAPGATLLVPRSADDAAP